MAKGLYLTVGLNAVDPKHYAGWEGRLRGCENDARDMASIATAAGCSGTTLLTQSATATEVLKQISQAAQALQPDDFFLLGYSGHGGQIKDVNGDDEDGLDETWCLYDRQLIDDELYAMWAQFRPGVRILVLSDSCHSGTVIRENIFNSMTQAMTDVRAIEPSEGDRSFGILSADVLVADALESDLLPKAMPSGLAWEDYIARSEIYDGVQYLAGSAARASITAHVLLVSGCQDNQLSGDGMNNGLFTAALKKTWNGGGFSGSYRYFSSAIGNLLPNSQSPNFYPTGAPSPAFEAQKPFTV